MHDLLPSVVRGTAHTTGRDRGANAAGLDRREGRLLRWRAGSTTCAILLCTCAVLAAGVFCPARAADDPGSMHGSADQFSAPGIALAWGVLRGVSEATTLVVVRIAADRAEFAAAAIVGLDPFTQRRQSLLPVTSTAASIEVRVPRAHFADFPRTELRLFGPADAEGTGVPKLVVFYLGVPDTTPEFASEAALEAYLAGRIAGTRTGTGSKPP